MRLNTLILILFFFLSTIYAQNYSVWFINPTNNSTVSGSIIDNTKSSINISFGFSGQKLNSQNKWKFKVIKDILTQESGGNTYAETWVYEDTPSCTLPGDVLYKNFYLIEMYEEDYINKTLILRARTSIITVYVQQTVFVVNNFGSGVISVNGILYPSGTSFNLSNGQSLYLTAIENQIDNQGYTRVWNSNGSNKSFWSIYSTPRNYSISFYYNANSNQNGAEITAVLKKVCNISFNGTVSANGNYYSTQPVPAIEGEPISITALSYTSPDYIDMAFSSWYDGTTQNPKTFTVFDNTTFNINYVGVKPNNGYKNFRFVGSVGENIQLEWNEHPNPNVTFYQIWRRVKHNGITGPDVHIATIGRGVCSFTDYDYTYTSSYSNDLLWYDVRAYYSSANSFADPVWFSVYGQMSLANLKESSQNLSVENEIPFNFSISNYPNPFNPTTKIKYELPKDGFISIKIYDALGKEITTLVNDYKKAGIYTTEFRAQSSELSSGIYFCRLVGDNVNITSKLILAK